MFTRELLKNMPDDFVKSKIAVFFGSKSEIQWLSSSQVGRTGCTADGLIEKESASWSSTVKTVTNAKSSWSQFFNPGRYDHNRHACHHDCQLKQVIGHIWTGPTSQRQYAAPFFKLIALQDLDFISKSRNQLLDLDLFNFCETIISFTIQSWTQMKILSWT